ncbi:D-alanyl-D-alanine carboxypeptidase/D-alanyl-D-alanine-endopeptidase [Chamaesiphon sp. OTE_20_metabat_361]|uniref:D-alanyl-D-alanine carboxypeptidase/D-alanyl-D-alanine endopeptidase n=1 Tax=Chamaesiphon sp. OTE_20_metabat_361 TaxID=2964689 RepID=UPI00286AD7F7|nr:D-alanyl-D-alanine carboxypeptidase/D-alanyl-D-alanine-endopeptidase [Chamaesiphon sp. OTE_20_metabat_361]
MQLFSSHRRIATTCGWLLVQLLTIVPARAQQPVAPPALSAVCASQVPAAINNIIDRPELRRYRWGIVVQVLGGPKQLYNRDGDRLFIPASNVKLITTAAALRQLGAAMRLRTSVYQLPSNGSFSNLLVVGRGDPSLTVSGLQSIAQQLQQRGIKQIGQISFDDSYFRGEQINSGWEWGDLSTDYAPAINGLMLNQNSNPLTVSSQQLGMPLRYAWKDPSLNSWQVDNRSLTIAASQDNNVDAVAMFGKPVIKLTGKLAVNTTPIQIDLPLADPAQSFISAFRQSLNRSGINSNSMRLGAAQSTINLPEIVAIDSPPITTLITETNQRSNNIYAEVLLRSIGRTHPEHSTSDRDTSNLGIALVKQHLTAMGVDPQAYSIYDGSGLSRHNLVAPTTFVRVLSVMATTPIGKIYRDSLPIAGISGSLKNRMKGTLAQGIVSAKTGSMSGVVSLSGYVNPPQYSPLVFSIILNQHDRPTLQMVKVIDEVMVVLASIKQC